MIYSDEYKSLWKNVVGEDGEENEAVQPQEGHYQYFYFNGPKYQAFRGDGRGLNGKDKGIACSIYLSNWQKDNSNISLEADPLPKYLSDAIIEYCRNGGYGSLTIQDYVNALTSYNHDNTK